MNFLAVLLSLIAVTCPKIGLAVADFAAAPTAANNTSMESSPTTGTCNGDGGYSCPAQDAVAITFTDTYDPTAVDWNAVVADIIAIGTTEPRFCNFAIRAWFHDISGFSDEEAGDFDGAADGSFLADTQELGHPEGALHGFGRFVRHVVLQIAAAHGASHADVLTVAAAKCTTEVLGGTVDIASHCEASGYPLYVGKTDWMVPAAYDELKMMKKAGNSPMSHDEIATILQFFIKEINGFVDKPNWTIDATEIMAVMGSHTIMMPQACMTDGQQPSDGTTPDMADRTCGGGRQRMFTWDNAWFKDVTAGICGKTNDQTQEGDFSQKIPPAQHQIFTQCGFNSMEGFELAEHLECSSMKTARATIAKRPFGDDILEKQEKVGAFNEGWQHIVWGRKFPQPRLPMNESAPCCGFQCETCEENPQSKFWCRGEVGENEETRFWPYTYMDCDFNVLFNRGAEGYCTGDFCNSCKTECEEWESFGHSRQEMVSLMKDMEAALLLFRENQAAWEESYAVAFCKLSAFGATWAPKQESFQKLFTGASQGCLNPTNVLSLKQCEQCTLNKFGTLNTSPLSPATPNAPSNPSPNPTAVTPSGTEDMDSDAAAATMPMEENISSEAPEPATNEMASLPRSNTEPLAQRTSHTGDSASHTGPSSPVGNPEESDVTPIQEQNFPEPSNVEGSVGAPKPSFDSQGFWAWYKSWTGEQN